MNSSQKMIATVKDWLESQGCVVPDDEVIVAELIEPIIKEWEHLFATEFNAHIFSDGTWLKEDTYFNK